MKKSKIISLALVLTMAVNIAACNREPAVDWREGAKEQVATEFNLDTCNQLYYSGKTYELPCSVKEFTDAGWQFSESEKDDELKGREVSEYYYTLTNEAGKTITVGLTNETEETLKVTECTVDDLEVTAANGDIMLPGGVTDDHYDTKEEIYEVISKDLFTDYKEMAMWDNCQIDTVNENGDRVLITIAVYESEDKDTHKKSYYLMSVHYQVEIVNMYNASEAYQMVIDSIYTNDPSKIDSDILAIDPEQFVTTLRLYLMGEFITRSGFDVENINISDETFAKLEDILAKAYEKNTCSIINVLSGNASEAKYMFTMRIYNLQDVIDLAMEKATERYEGNLENMETNSEFFDIFCEEVINAYDELKAPIMPTDVIVDFNTDGAWDTLVLAYLGVVEE